MLLLVTTLLLIDPTSSKDAARKMHSWIGHASLTGRGTGAAWATHSPGTTRWGKRPRLPQQAYGHACASVVAHKLARVPGMKPSGGARAALRSDGASPIMSLTLAAKAKPGQWKHAHCWQLDGLATLTSKRLQPAKHRGCAA
jgi:hypothetical protein